MNIYFTASNDVSSKIKKQYREIINLLSGLDYNVLEGIFDKLSTHRIGKQLSYEDIHNHIINKINQSDILIADISIPSGGVGYQIYHAYSQKKPIIILYSENKNSNPSIVIRGMDPKRIYLLKYDTISEIQERLPGIINDCAKRLKVRFNLVLPGKTLSYLNRQSAIKGISTTRLMRRIIEDYIKKNQKRG